MTVNQTSNTSGDGDRDELYFKVARLGPGTQSSEKRLPGEDDYYEAKNGKTVNSNGWTNRDETHVNNPIFWSAVPSIMVRAFCCQLLQWSKIIPISRISRVGL